MNQTPPGYWVISDTAFPRCTNQLNHRIFASMKKGDQLPGFPLTFPQLKLLNEQLVSAQQSAEWGMQAVQGSFSRMKLPLPATDHLFRAKVLELWVWLHQVRCQSVHINQTQAVYQSVKEEHVLLGQSFHQMLFPDIQH